MIPLDAGGSEMISELFSISLEIRRRIRRSGMNRLVDLP
jgi:hypothetical protein